MACALTSPFKSVYTEDAERYGIPDPEAANHTSCFKELATATSWQKQVDIGRQIDVLVTITTELEIDYHVIRLVQIRQLNLKYIILIQIQNPRGVTSCYHRHYVNEINKSNS